MNALKSCFLIYFNKNEIHNNPVINDISKPKPNINKLEEIIAKLLSFIMLNNEAPATTGIDK